MKNNKRPIVIFTGNVSPKKIVETIGTNFSGDIVVNGSLSDVYSGEDTHTNISTNGGSLYLIDGGIYLYNEVTIEADVFIDKDIDVDEPLTIFGSLYSYSRGAIEGYDIYVGENLYILYEVYMDVDNLVVGQDFHILVDAKNFPADVCGEIILETE